MDKKNPMDLITVRPEVLTFIDKTDLSSLEYDDLVQLGLSVTEVKTYTQWLLGKLGDRITGKYGDLTKYAKDIHQNYEVLQQYMNTYRKFIREDPNFSPERYAGALPWGMMQLVATKSDKPIELLDDLIDKGVHTQEGAYREIKTRQTGKEIPSKPHIKLQWDAEKEKWRINIADEYLDMIDWSAIREQLMSYLNSLA